ncbi:MAG TPA: ATP-binding protein [Polyangia bacterium]|nr:ATP-binding protein [Polyangia bacterium]
MSPKVLGPLGAEQLADPALAILELIKNAWDADATRVRISIYPRKSSGHIVVEDDGHGMTEEEFGARWLVIGSSNKRGADTTESGRRVPIGEKGLGRLATFSLGKIVTIDTVRVGHPAFAATIDWSDLLKAETLEDYGISMSSSGRARGTEITIRDLAAPWNDDHTQFLISHAQFLTAVPGDNFAISLKVDGVRQPLEDPIEAISRLSEGDLEMKVASDGTPDITACHVEGVNRQNTAFRPIKDTYRDSRLAGMRVHLRFFRRDTAARRLGESLKRNDVNAALERYQGFRVFRDGINVPPYGINGNDWAGLEKQRTATGGPTMVPGNSQLVGEVHLSRRSHNHLIITAGRSGFADQRAVTSIANYIRWAVREFGTARRAQKLGLPDGAQVPGRVETARDGESTTTAIRHSLRELASNKTIQNDPELRRSLAELSVNVLDDLDEQESTLRLYAQLASTGIAATSFAHELRAEFDVVSEALSELSGGKRKPDAELLRVLNEAWSRIRAFAGLFKVVPVKSRRRRMLLAPRDAKQAVEVILGLAPPEHVHTRCVIPTHSFRLVISEFDSIVLNLVSNAVKAIASSKNRTSGRIEVRFHASKQDLEIKVADNGCGVSKRVAAVMFEPLEGQFEEGTGMGLPIVKFIAERYDGHVSLAPTPPNGYETEFVVRLRNVVE